MLRSGLRLVLCLASAVSCPASGGRCDELAPPQAAVAGDESELEGWWADLAKEEPFASHALLQFSRKPQETIAFLKPRLKPLTIEPEHVRKLIEDLGSDDETVWKPAFETLDYLDPRLAIDLETLINEVQESPARQRLVEVLSGREPGSLQGQDVGLRSTGPNGYNFFSKNGSWWAEHLVSRLRSGGWGNRKRQWERAVRAVVLLDFLDTPESLALVEAMASGCPDAEPTAVAQGVFDARKAEGR